MSFSAGVFTINTTGQPVVTGTVISAPVFNAFTADIATGLSTCLLKDGTQTVTANIPMSGFKFTGLAAGSAAGDSLRYEQLGFSPYTTTATAAGTTTLTSSSTQTQYFTGTTTQSVTMPVVSTLTLGQTFIIVNLSTGSLTVRASDASSVILTVPAGTQATFTVIAITGTDATSWNVEITGFASATGTGAVARATSPTFVTPTLGVASATSINFGQTALSYYGEGTWTPSDGSGAGLSFTSPLGTYTRIGRMFLAGFSLTYPATASGANATVDGIPFTVANSATARTGFISACSSASNATQLVPTNNGTTFLLANSSFTLLTNTNMSGATLRGAVVSYV